ncbi:MAG: hypothetical protein ACLVJ6_15910 [Merdibacter sp.]
MVQDGNKQACTEKADKAASWLVPVALLIAILAYVFTGNMITAVTVRRVLSYALCWQRLPRSWRDRTGDKTRRDHQVRRSPGEMGKVDTIAFDKTGTLTYGRLDVSDVIAFDETISETSLLSLAASAEAKSEHPLGKRS